MTADDLDNFDAARGPTSSQALGLTLAAARRMVAAVEATAREMRVAMAVAVVDGGDQLVAAVDDRDRHRDMQLTGDGLRGRDHAARGREGQPGGLRRRRSADRVHVVEVGHSDRPRRRIATSVNVTVPIMSSTAMATSTGRRCANWSCP